MARNIHQRLSNFINRLLSLLQALHDKRRRNYKIGHGEVFLRESSPRTLSKCLEDISDGVYCYLT